MGHPSIQARLAFALIDGRERDSSCLHAVVQVKAGFAPGRRAASVSAEALGEPDIEHIEVKIADLVQQRGSRRVGQGGPSSVLGRP